MVTMPTVPPLHILVVEDEPDVAHLIKHTLERNGDLKVDIAAAGHQIETVVGLGYRFVE